MNFRPSIIIIKIYSSVSFTYVVLIPNVHLKTSIDGIKTQCTCCIQGGEKERKLRSKAAVKYSATKLYDKVQIILSIITSHVDLRAVNYDYSSLSLLSIV